MHPNVRNARMWIKSRTEALSLIQLCAMHDTARTNNRDILNSGAACQPPIVSFRVEPTDLMRTVMD